MESRSNTPKNGDTHICLLRYGTLFVNRPTKKKYENSTSFWSGDLIGRWKIKTIKT